MPLIGNISEFYDYCEEWDLYVQQLEQYFKANVIKIMQNASVLLSVVGRKAFRISNDLCEPNKPGDKRFSELVTVLDNHLNSK